MEFDEPPADVKCEGDIGGFLDTVASNIDSTQRGYEHMDIAETTSELRESSGVTPVYPLRNRGVGFSSQGSSLSEDASNFSPASPRHPTMDDFSMSLRENFKNLRKKSMQELPTQKSSEGEMPAVSSALPSEQKRKDSSVTLGDGFKLCESDKVVALIKRSTGVSSITFRRKSSSKNICQSSPQRYVSILKPSSLRNASFKPPDQLSEIPSDRPSNIITRTGSKKCENDTKVPLVSKPLRILPVNLQRNLNKLLSEGSYLLNESAEPSAVPDSQTRDDSSINVSDNFKPRNSSETPPSRVKNSAHLKRNSLSKLSKPSHKVLSKFSSVAANNRRRRKFTISVT